MDQLPFDPTELRLREASQQVAALAGHEVEIVVDVALMPEYEYYFHETLIDALESLARDLDANAECLCKRWFPKTIAVNYDAAADRRSPYRGAVLDTKALSLTIPVGPRSGLVPPEMLDAVLEDAYGDLLVARYEGKEATDVAAKDHREYFEYLRGSWYDLQTGERRAEPDGDALRKSVGVYARSRDETLRRDLAEFATKEGESTLRYAYARGELSADNKNGDLPRAAKALGSFVRAHESSLTAQQRLRIANTIYVGNRDEMVPAALPGLDSFAFGLRVIDQWLARGATYDGLEGDQRKLTGFVVCHHPPNSSDGTCRDEAFYKWAWGVPGGKKKLAAALMKRRNKKFVEAAMYALDEPLQLLRLLEPDAATWRMGAEIVGEHYVQRGADWVPSEVERLWRKRPADRGALLFLLAKHDPDGREEEVWGRFAKRYGSLASGKDFAAFLGASPTAWSCLGGVFKALAPGVKKGAVIASKMGAFLDGDPDGVYRTSLAIAHNLCDRGTATDRAKMLGFWRSRIRNHASERRVLTVAMDFMKPGGCK
ncbi:MAG: hypothetical protein AAF721_22715 [Myxococcota bacterium]